MLPRRALLLATGRGGAILLLAAQLPCWAAFVLVLHWHEAAPRGWALAALAATVALAAGVRLCRRGALRPQGALAIALGFAACLGLGALLSDDLVPPPRKGIPPISDLRITAIGTRGAGQGTEVWFVGAFRADGARIPWSEFRMDPSWERRGDVFVSYRDQPAAMTLRGSFPDRLELRFAAHPWSGLAEIIWNGAASRLDLFAATGTERRVTVNDRPAGGLLAALYSPALLLAGGLPGLAGLSLALALPRRTRTALLPLPFLLPFAFVALATAPGLYTPDSISQLLQAQRHAYADWHPPLMAGLWSLLIGVTGSPEALFWLHLGLLAAGFLGLAWAALRAGLPIAVPLLLLGACGPQVLNFAGVLWKDVGMAAALLAGFAAVAMARAAGRGQGAALAVALPLALYAAGLRVNAAPAILPLLYLAVHPFVAARRRLAAGAMTLAAAALLFAANYGLAYNVLGAAHQHPEQYVQAMDLAGLLVSTGQDRIPPSAKTDGFSAAAVRANYRPSTSNRLFWASPGEPTPPLRFAADLTTAHPADPAAIAQLRAAWMDAIRADPATYLANRAAILAALLRLDDPAPYGAWLDPGLQRDQVTRAGLDVGPPLPGRDLAAPLLLHYLVWAGTQTWLLLGWPWALALLVLTAAGLILRRAPLADIATGLGFSGLLYLLPYPAAAPAADFRYLYWCVLAATAGLALLAGAVIRPRAPPRRRS